MRRRVACTKYKSMANSIFYVRKVNDGYFMTLLFLKACLNLFN